MTTTWLFYVGLVPSREDVVLSQPLLRRSIEAFRAALFDHEATVRSNEVVLEVELRTHGETHSEAADRAREAIDRALGEAGLSDLFRFDSFMTGMGRRDSG